MVFVLSSKVRVKPVSKATIAQNAHAVVLSYTERRPSVYGDSTNVRVRCVRVSITRNQLKKIGWALAQVSQAEVRTDVRFL